MEENYTLQQLLEVFDLLKVFSELTEEEKLCVIKHSPNEQTKELLLQMKKFTDKEKKDSMKKRLSSPGTTNRRASIKRQEFVIQLLYELKNVENA